MGNSVAPGLLNGHCDETDITEMPPKCRVVDLMLGKREREQLKTTSGF